MQKADASKAGSAREAHKKTGRARAVRTLIDADFRPGNRCRWAAAPRIQACRMPVLAADQMPPASGALQHRMQRRSGLRIEARELVAKLLQAFDLILERRQRIRQAPDVDLQPVDAR